MMMNQTEYYIPHTLDSIITSSEIQSIDKLHIQFPLAQLKHEFQEILLHPKHNLQLEADYYQASVPRSTLSTSATTDNTSSNTLYSEDYAALYTLLSVEDINTLHGIAATLESTEYLPDSTRIYIDRRKGVVNLIWRRLYQKVNNRDVHHCVDFAQVINEKLQWWIQVANIFLGHVFMKEKMFYEEIFANTDDYLDIIGETALNLFEFAGTLVSSPHFPRNLEMLLPVYQQVLDQMPAVDLLFQKDSSSPLAININCQATGLVSQISKHMTQVLLSCRSQVLEEASMAPPGGKLHTMTEYVTRYVELICNYRNHLADLIKSLDLEVGNGVNDSIEEKHKEPFLLSIYVTRIIDSLLHNLKKKSLVYENESLGYIFMMNNVYHVAERIKSSPRMQVSIDKDLQSKLSETVNQAMCDYLGTSWKKVLECLDIDKSKPSGISRWILDKFNKPVKSKLNKPGKSKFNTFNQLFDEILEREAEWVVHDQKLRKKLHQLILDKVILAYTSFLKLYSSRIKKLPHPERYIKYSVMDLESKISGLFQCELLALVKMIDIMELA